MLKGVDGGGEGAAIVEHRVEGRRGEVGLDDVGDSFEDGFSASVAAEPVVGEGYARRLRDEWSGVGRFATFWGILG